MTTTNFNTVNELSNAKADNKTAKYLEMAFNFTVIAKEYEENDSFMSRMAAKEVVTSWRKCESADCEYTMYVNANAAEKWLEKAIQTAR